MVILVFKELPGEFVGTAPVVCEVTLGVDEVSVVTLVFSSPESAQLLLHGSKRRHLCQSVSVGRF